MWPTVSCTLVSKVDTYPLNTAIETTNEATPMTIPNTLKTVVKLKKRRQEPK
jgi:hypothetical protein